MLLVVLEEVLTWCLALPLAWLQNFPCSPSAKLRDVKNRKEFSESLKLQSQCLVMLCISLCLKI